MDPEKRPSFQEILEAIEIPILEVSNFSEPKPLQTLNNRDSPKEVYTYNSSLNPSFALKA